MKRAFLAWGPIAATFVVAVILLAPPERAVKGAHYVNVGGRAADALPSGVPTLALRVGSARETQGEIERAISVTTPEHEQEHVVVAASPMSLVANAFFTSKEPATSEIAPSFSPWTPVSGRAAVFPENADLFISENPLGTASNEGVRRAGTGGARRVNVRNIPSTERSVQLHDYG